MAMGIVNLKLEIASNISLNNRKRLWDRICSYFAERGVRIDTHQRQFFFEEEKMEKTLDGFRNFIETISEGKLTVDISFKRQNIVIKNNPKK